MSIAKATPGLAAAIDKAGTRYALARILGLTPNAVLKWRDVPVHRILEIEEKLGIPRQTLRPELYAAA